jgi:hypothetical protein
MLVNYQVWSVRIVWLILDSKNLTQTGSDIWNRVKKQDPAETGSDIWNWVLKQDPAATTRTKLSLDSRTGTKSQNSPKKKILRKKSVWLPIFF